VQRNAISILKERRAYWDAKDLRNGWMGSESGPCCPQCAMRDEHFTGRADALKAVVGCRDPFQTKCECHLPSRRAMRTRMVEELTSVINAIES
jgi:hypothetical protein